MNKLTKSLLITGLAISVFCATGCGEEKKKEEPKKPATTTTTTKTTTTNTTTAAKANRPKDGKNYYYPSYIKDVNDTPAMTPEMTKYIDNFAAKVKLHPSEKGKFVNDSKISKGAKFCNMWFHAKGANFDNKVKFKDSKGKDRYQEEIFHMYMNYDLTKKVPTSVEWVKFERNQANPDGKKTTLMKKKL